MPADYGTTIFQGVSISSFVTQMILNGINFGVTFIGLYLVYQAYRYNFLFVYEIDVDTKGLVYPRALQHLLTGIYLAEICMIGLFAIKGAIGPVVIMVLFTIGTVLAHMSLNEALAPLNTFLPRSP